MRITTTRTSMPITFPNIETIFNITISRSISNMKINILLILFIDLSQGLDRQLKHIMTQGDRKSDSPSVRDFIKTQPDQTG